MKLEEANSLKSRVLDYLHEQGFEPDGSMQINAFVTFDQSAVHVGLLPVEFRCTECREKGLLRKIFDGLDRLVRRGWCDSCSAKWGREHDFRVRGMAEMKAMLDRAFKVTPGRSDSPASALLVTG